MMHPCAPISLVCYTVKGGRAVQTLDNFNNQWVNYLFRRGCEVPILVKQEVVQEAPVLGFV